MDFFNIYFVIGLLFATATFIIFVTKPNIFRSIYIGKHMNYNIVDVLLICIMSVPFWPPMLFLIIASQWRR